MSEQNTNFELCPQNFLITDHFKGYRQNDQNPKSRYTVARQCTRHCPKNKDKNLQINLQWWIIRCSDSSSFIDTIVNNHVSNQLKKKRRNYPHLPKYNL